MPLRIKVIALVVFLNIVALATIYLALNKFLLQEFIAQDYADTQELLNQLDRAVEFRVNDLDTLTKDWAFWDDTYNFVINRNDKYIQTNFVDSTFLNTGVSLAVVVDNKPEIVYSKYLDLETGRKLELPKELIDFALMPSKKGITSGLILLGQTPAIISIQPILKSDETGPSNGYIIFGKLMSDREYKVIKDITKLTSQFYPINNLPTDVKGIYTSNLTSKPGFIHTEGPNKITGYLVFNDVYNNNAVLASISTPRNVYNHGTKILKLVSLVSVMVLFVSFITSLYFADVAIIRPFKKILSDIVEVKVGKGHTKRLGKYGISEIDVLAESINKMIDTLESSEESLMDTNKSLQKQRQELETKTKELERMIKHMVGREVRMSELKNELDSLKSKLEEKYAK